MAEPDGSIATYYRIDAGKPALPVGGLRAYPASDAREPARRLIAVRAPDHAPPRASLINDRAAGAVPNALTPLECGAGRDPAGGEALFMICPALPGGPIGAETPPWPEAEIIRCLLLPAAAALEAMQARGQTHRAIRPDNVFRAGPGAAVVLGPCWAAPPASLQPAVFEPPYSAWCPPAARGDGTIADDVYALAVVMLSVALGRVPLAELDDEAILLRKLDLGSAAALTSFASLPPLIADLARSMLAEDPDHRPSPAHLLDPEQARSRRVVARPPRRAQRPLVIGVREAWTARDLAYALGTQPDRASAMLRNGSVDRWLRRALGDAQLAVRLDEALQRRNQEQDPEDSRQQQMLVMKAVAILDPLAPLLWRGGALWPDGLGAFLASAQGKPPNQPAPPAAEAAAAKRRRGAIEEIITEEVIVHWLGCHSKRRDLASLAEEARQWRTVLRVRGPSGGWRRLLYNLNPLLPCLSPLLGGGIVLRAQELLPALEAAAGTADRRRPPADGDVAAFLAARSDSGLQAEIAAVGQFAEPEDLLGLLALFAQLQARFHPEALPGLTAWLVECGPGDLSMWRSLKTRQALGARLAALTADGQMQPIVLALRDDAARAQDRAGAARAAARIEAVTAALAELERDGPRRRRSAQRLAHDATAGAGLLAILGAGASLVMAG